MQPWRPRASGRSPSPYGGARRETGKAPLRLCATLLAAAPADVDALHLLGILQSRLGRPDEAVRLLGLARNQGPGHVAALSNLALILARLGQREEALAYYAKALALHPDSAEIHNNRGHARLAAGAGGEALADFDRALALKPDYAEAHNNRGIALPGSGGAGGAGKLRSRADDPSRSCRRAGNRASALRESNRLDEALRGYAAAIAADTGFAEAYNNRGLALLEWAAFRRPRAISPAPSRSGPIMRRRAQSRGDRAADRRHTIGGATTSTVADPGFSHRGAPVAAPAWRGEDLGGKAILVQEEQGLGDVIQFARFLPILARAGPA